MKLFKQATTEDLDAFTRVGASINAQWYRANKRVQLGLDQAIQMAIQESFRRHEARRQQNEEAANG